MKKFNILQSNHLLMTPFGLYSDRLTEPTNEFFKSIGAYFVLTATMLTVIASIIGITKSVDYRFILDAILIVIAMTASFFVFLTAGMKMKEIKELHLRLQSVIDTGMIFSRILCTTFQLKCDYLELGEDDVIHDLYWNAEQKCRKYTKNLAMIHVFYVQTAYCVVFLYSIYCLCTANFDASTWPTVYDIYVPLDTATVLGWYIQFFFGNLMEVCYFLTMVLPTAYFICCGVYIRTMCKHFLELMISMQRKIEQQEQDANLQTHVKNYRQIKTQFSKAIKIHMEILK